MNRTIKRTAIPLSGYVYQNFVGLNLLCDWLDDPTLYRWVKFEADDREVAQGLDDIVAQCHDDSYILIQVKFTVDADDPSNALNWSWLLDHRPRGRSNLQKWADTWSSQPSERIRSAKLITNRKPDRKFASNLDASLKKIDFDTLSHERRAQIIDQLGSEQHAIDFFSAFEFDHSSQGFVALERTLIDRFVPLHTELHGWLALFREAVNWALLKNVPFPDGKITLNLLRGTIDKYRPVPLEQSFRIPEGYRPPDDRFATQFIDDLVSTESNIFVLWGAPGQGKSTFISFVSNELEEQSVPYIRHHYFLNLYDASDRFTLQSVANSLMAQMEQQHTAHVQGLKDGAENLKEWITRCADGYRQEGEPFIIIVDGLDHVWRENDRNKAPLDSLFSQLFPLPENAVLLIGTQKVSVEQLPKNFRRYVPENSWVQLPSMSLTCIRQWLATMHGANRFELSSQGMSQGDDQLAEVAMAFERVSNGHPLILTYSFEYLARKHHTLTPQLVEHELPLQAGDVTNYYHLLWDQLSHTAKDALHLAVDAGFFWPVLGLECCLGVSAGVLHSEIGHLFYQSEAGEVPFHGSLNVFVQAQREHEEHVAALLPEVVEWLDKSAPPFHRWGWLWLYKARAGDPRALLSGANRQWVIDSLTQAYPIDQIESVLTEAESIAFEAGDFPAAIRYRWLKIRTLNGPEFQVDDYNRLYRWALQLSNDDYPLNLLSAEERGTSTDNLYLLGKQYLAAERVDDAVECLERIRQRINDRAQAKGYAQGDFGEAVKLHLELLAGTRQFEAERVANNVRQIFGSSSANVFSEFLRELSRHEDLELLMRFMTVLMLIGMRRELELSCVRLAGYLGVKLQDWPAFKQLGKHPISAFWKKLYAKDQCTESAFRVYRDEFDSERSLLEAEESLAEYFHALFFHAVVRCMAAGGVRNSVTPPKYRHHIWISVAAEKVLQVADAIGALLSRGEIPSFDLPFRLSSSINPPLDFDDQRIYQAFRKALTCIALDVFLVVRPMTSLTSIPVNDWHRALGSPHFHMHRIRDQYLAAGFKTVATETIASQINEEQRKTSGSINRLNERIESYIDLCNLAFEYDLLELARELLHRIFACIIGYGWRKDSTLRNVLSAIESIIPVDEEFARQMVVRISPICDRISELTEDDGVRESDLADALLQLMPSAYVAYYRHWLGQAEWYTSERIYARLLAMHDLNSICIPLVASAVWSGPEVYELRKRADAGDRVAEGLVAQNAQQFGYSYEALGKERERGSGHEEKDVEIEVGNFPPGKLSELLEALKEQHAYTAEGRVVQEWFAHWVDDHQGIPVLRDLEQFLAWKEYLPSGVTELFDLAFSLSLELEGKRKAYKWLVAAQITRRSWSQYYGRNEALQRFEVFAEHYRDRWHDFVLETTRPSSWIYSDGITIPHDRLVDFLIAVQEYELAKKVVMVMVDTTVEDFSDIPLEVPVWLTLDS